MLPLKAWYIDDSSWRKLTPKQQRIATLARASKLEALRDERNKMQDTAVRCSQRTRSSEEPKQWEGMTAHYTLVTSILTEILDALEDNYRIEVI